MPILKSEKSEHWKGYLKTECLCNDIYCTYWYCDLHPVQRGGCAGGWACAWRCGTCRTGRGSTGLPCPSGCPPCATPAAPALPVTGWSIWVSLALAQSYLSHCLYHICVPSLHGFECLTKMQQSFAARIASLVCYQVSEALTVPVLKLGSF